MTLPRPCLDCGTPTGDGSRCPPCERTRDAARGTTTQRGYGTSHQRARRQHAAAFRPGQPCARCGRPIATLEQADLGHNDDRTGYNGLEHAACNRGCRHAQ
jgi:hypothetical protein